MFTPRQYTPKKYEISRRENRCILKIKDATPDDEAEYKCEVDGDVTACQLKVDGKTWWQTCVQKDTFHVKPEVPPCWNHCGVRLPVASEIKFLYFPEPEFEFTKPLNDTDATEKEAATFVCEVNDADAKVKWFKENQVRGQVICV